jgi:predicted polyphosphate/ATP-dependent NAD kinase
VTVGLVVNPLAGVGGPAGLKGSDGADVQLEALARGGRTGAGRRAADALRVLAAGRPDERILTLPGAMGADAARAAGLDPVVVALADHGDAAGAAGAGSEGRATTGADSTAGAAALVAAGATLVLFAGGDGTARDVAAGMGTHAALLGIPAGVKMYSPCFAVSPAAAGAIALEWLARGPLPTVDADVLDIDERQLRIGPTEPTLFATVRIPDVPSRTQARKAAAAASSAAAVADAAAGAAAAVGAGVRCVLGPGSTMLAVARALGVEGTPLGVDVVLDGRLVLRDASERELLAELARGPAKAIVTVIGGQGFLLGRGNQQLSPAVLRAIGPDPLVVVATEQKLIDLGGRPLLVDTGDAALDRALAGHVRVRTGRRASSLYPVRAPEAESAAPARAAGRPASTTTTEGGR